MGKSSATNMCQGTTESNQVHLNAQPTTGSSPDHLQQLDQQLDPFAIMIAQCGLIDTLLHKSTLEQDDDSHLLTSMPKFEETSVPQCSPGSSSPIPPSSAPSSAPSPPRSPSSNSLAERIHELYGKPHTRKINKGGTLNELFDCAAEALARRSEKSTHTSPSPLITPENFIADSWERLEKQSTISWIDVHRMVKELTEQLEDLRVAPNKQEYKKLLLKWHPDKFTQNYGGKVRKGEEDRVMEKVTKTFQMLMNARPTCEAA